MMIISFIIRSMKNNEMEKEVMVQRGGGQGYVHAVRMPSTHPLFEKFVPFKWNPSRHKGKKSITITRAVYNWITAGRPLSKNEQLVHLNGDILDDTLENLEALTSSERAQLVNFRVRNKNVDLPLGLLKAYVEVIKLRSKTRGERMSKEEDREFLERALKDSENSNVIEENVTNEQVWNSLKRNALNLSKQFDLSFTEEEIKTLDKKADSFNKFANNTLKGIADDYNEKYRERELSQRDEDIKIRKAHEINEATRLLQTHPEAGRAIVCGMMQLLGLDSATPKLSEKAIEAKAIEQKDISVSVSLKDI